MILNAIYYLSVEDNWYDTGTNGKGNKGVDEERIPLIPSDSGRGPEKARHE